ncbi:MULTISPECIES: tripartite tricarboxylate transporter TctB family protein [Pseudomonas]|uniref:tripartite tricarboxylate transporter TctB family protein n=1 Tax=Pseudomonas TaxID=286 RepID=UPI0004AC080D|nr:MULTISPECIES: tripartite tricarboxylate transporter TctB family protein [Pseudomonas]AIC19306.1 tripartite tricarboxylate transporter TctB [Pseudomonas chlororaphis]AZE04390.1 Tricarboxylate transport protein TctB [Pseudomonas chlororaphis subsp. aureofaciens]AZE16596.1 Tricarboxylate transport protein TctB [Pseudomonas chlororaphis subsp. aureofaciens]MBP5065408.1 tripartite tricarboxylate transporter TctB family protein [Pseudomonas chlororaphis]POA64898.1 tripartite tricarboxylate transp
MAGRSRVVLSQLAIGLGLIAISLVLVIGALRFPPEMGFVILGAHVYPSAVGAFLGAVGLLLSYQACTGGLRELAASGDDSDDSAQPGGRLGAAWVTAGLVAIAVLINLIGFVLAAGLLFACSARGFGSRRPLRDLAIGIALTLPIYWLFSAGLGVALPPLVNAWI